MNSDEIWLLQLWSGVFGAAISAVLAAGVALLVVTMTNKHQTKIAEAAKSAQEKQAANALAAQERMHAEQLVEQRAGLTRQLEEQQAETARARQAEAIMEFIKVTEKLVYEDRPAKEEQDTFGHIAELRAGLARIRMSSPETNELCDVLESWPYALGRLCISSAFAREQHRASGDWQAMNTAATKLHTFLPAWLLHKESRSKVLKVLKDAGEVLQKRSRQSDDDVEQAADAKSEVATEPES
ncbi:hypothetical protein [Paenarthrobacter nitroguajacolicus]|uniref:hypothetical protein n=1 Tax=Paenarthrobacter nitroguajacolicus TaxID=211146 RepID=UPI00248ABBE2|nr:hypothetical protein [Paenarthrobacter nitroguajacolicus]